EAQPSESPSNPPWDWKAALILFFVMILINLLVISSIQSGFLILTGWQFDPLSGAITAPGNILGPWLGTISGELIILFITLFFTVYLCKSKLRALNFRWPSLKHTLIAIGGVALAFGASIVGGILQYYLTGPDPTEESYNLLFQTSNGFELIGWVLLMMCVVAPCEEIFARGFVQQGFQNSFKVKKKSIFIGIAIASLLFAVVHLNFYRIIPLFLVGFILGLIYYYTDNNAMASAITHGLYNALIIIIPFFFP
ncbi:MAG: CPBP family intramembrane metalloprotease, partial [Candidatus Helarchaeota archaeon]|nr:CPBP family intramembrane metalloprotease [Candidatus Helarchaeota archaeon]